MSQTFSGCETTFGALADNSSYRVCFDKPGKHLPGFSRDWDVARGARQFLKWFEQVEFTRDGSEFRGYSRLKQLQCRIRTGQIDQDYFQETLL